MLFLKVQTNVISFARPSPPRNQTYISYICIGRKVLYHQCRLEIVLLLSRFSRVRLCATPETAAHQAPLSWDSPDKNTGVGCHFLLQCMKVKSESEVAQSYLTLSDPRDCSPPGSSVHGKLRTRVLEWVAIPFSRDQTWVSRTAGGLCTI